MKVSYPFLTISVSREEIPLETIHPDSVPDEKWRYVDKQGHGHFWEGKQLPTLEWVVTGSGWVGDEYEGNEYEVGEYRCRLCGEVIKPKRKVEYGPKHIPGPATYVVTIDNESFTLTEEQYGDALIQWAPILREAQYGGRKRRS